MLWATTVHQGNLRKKKKKQGRDCEKNGWENGIIKKKLNVRSSCVETSDKAMGVPCPPNQKFQIDEII